MNSTAYHTKYDDLISCKDNIFSRKFMEVYREWGEFYLNILNTAISGNKIEYPIPASIRRSVSKDTARLLEPLIFFRNSTFYPEWKFKDLGYDESPEKETSDSSFHALDSLIHKLYHNNLFFITGEKNSGIFKNYLKKLTVFVFKPDLLEQLRYDNLLTFLLMEKLMCSEVSKLIHISGKDFNISLYDFGYLDTYFYEYLSKGDIHPYRKITQGNLEYHIDTVNLLKTACLILDEFGYDDEERNWEINKTASKEKYRKPNAISLTLNLSKNPDKQYATADIFKFSDEMGYYEMNEKMTGLIATTDTKKLKLHDKLSSTLGDILNNHTASLFKTVESDVSDKIVHYL